jgi:hypothetical protein
MLNQNIPKQAYMDRKTLNLMWYLVNRLNVQEISQLQITLLFLPAIIESMPKQNLFKKASYRSIRSRMSLDTCHVF